MHLQALRRSAVVCFVGLAIWIALAVSASSQACAAKSAAQAGVPSWTLGKATSFDSFASLRSAAKASACASPRK